MDWNPIKNVNRICVMSYVRTITLNSSNRRQLELLSLGGHLFSVAADRAANKLVLL
jgi:hypothetical protein